MHHLPSRSVSFFDGHFRRSARTTKALKLKPLEEWRFRFRGDVLDFGASWANLAFAAARRGFAFTALDASRRAIECSKPGVSLCFLLTGCLFQRRDDEAQQAVVDRGLDQTRALRLLDEACNGTRGAGSRPFRTASQRLTRMLPSRTLAPG